MAGRDAAVAEGGEASAHGRAQVGAGTHLRLDRARRQLRGLFVGIGVLVVGFGIVAVASMGRMDAVSHQITDNELPGLTLAGDVRASASQHHFLVLSHVLAEDRATMESLEAQMAEAETSVGDRLQSFTGRVAEDKESLLEDEDDGVLAEGVSQAWLDYLAATEVVLAASRANSDAPGRLIEANWDPAFEALNTRLSQLNANEVSEAEESFALAERSYFYGVGLTVGALVLILTGVGVAAVLAGRAVRTGTRETGRLVDDALIEASRARVFQRLADRVTFADGEADLVAAASAAVRQLVEVDRGDLLILNPSRDRLTVGAGWGEAAPSPGSVVDAKPVSCPGVRQGAVFESTDVTDELSVRCQVHRTRSGFLLCVPMIAMNQTVGVMHLERDRDFSSDETRLAVRTAEQVALALANARLLRTMETMAMTDSLTGLHNARFFDPLLEVELATAAREATSLAVVMIDLDNFKKLNDVHGHHAGDEALRSFARTLRSALREADVAARYGGEEFVVLLHATDGETALAVADKVRAAVELNPVEIAPGRRISITASFGVASTGLVGYDSRALLRLADRALYRAKQTGRNRAELADLHIDGDPLSLASEDESATSEVR